MEFFQLVLGLVGSLCNYSCPWRRVHKNQMEDMTKPLDFFSILVVCREHHRI